MRAVDLGPVIGLVGQGALLAELAGTVGLGPAGWLIGAGCGTVGYLVLREALPRRDSGGLRPADRITLIRAALAGGVAALVADGLSRPIPVRTLVLLAALALVLDAVDGPVARWTRSASALGARFDLEVDAFLILVLSWYVARSAGLWVLAIGGARYAFVVAGWFVPALRAPSPPRYWCKVVAAVQGIVLTVAAAAVLPFAITEGLLAIALTLLAESFGRQTWWLLHQVRVRRPEPERPRLLSVPPGGGR
ncbi:MAG TPA: CDP-alcohol phosphatidyltransferase family protein [Jatrophihabitans sp.]|nr:CDP-alcohol phosphatidyltransferase family protein [Jatrophihabitans sp.]